MGLRFEGQKYGECFFITTSFLDRKPLGNIKGVYEILAESLNFRVEKSGARLLSYVFMPSHIHLVLLIEGKILPGLMRDFKKYTAQKHLIKLCKSNPIWQPRYGRQAIWSEKILQTKINYIHNNPIKAGLVDSIEDWQYSSAADYLGRDNGPVVVWKNWHKLTVRSHSSSTT
jgi:REP element-mobilizing transposase RayT